MPNGGCTFGINVNEDIDTAAKVVNHRRPKRPVLVAVNLGI